MNLKGLNLLKQAGRGWAVLALSVAAFLAALNIAGQFFYLRFDFSDGQIYSPSKASKRILKSLEDPVIVKCYFSKDLPQPYATYRDYLRDLLRAYKNLGGKNFDFRFVSLPKDEDFRREAMNMGVAPVRLTYIAKDKYEIKDGFMGAVLLHGDKRETIPVIRDMNGLEYDLTTRIKKLTTKEPRVVATLTGKGSNSISSEAMEAVRENYEHRELDLEDPVDSSRLPKSLVVYGPRERFSDAELAKLEQLVLAGVPTALFLDTKNVDINSGALFASNVDTGLERLLEHWGLGLKKGFVLDIQNQNITIQQRAGPFIMNNIVSYPLLPIVTNMSQESPLTKDMDQVTFPFVSAISTDGVKESLKAEVLAASTRLSWMKNDLTNLSPMADFSPKPEDPRGPFALAVTLEGSFPALFPNSVAKSTPVAGGAWLAQSKTVSRILVAGTSKILEQNISAGMSNLVFFLNTVDWLSEDADLVAVRSKGVKLRAFTRQLGDASRQIVKFASILLMPLLVVGFGLARWQARRRWKAQVTQRLVEPQPAAV